MRLDELDQSRKKIKAITIFLLFFYMLLIAYSFSPYAYATGFSRSNMNGVRDVLQILASAGGAVGLAVCGVRIAYGSPEVAGQAKKTAFIIILATVSLFALPYVIRIAIRLAVKHKWNPANLK